MQSNEGTWFETLKACLARSLVKTRLMFLYIARTSILRTTSEASHITKLKIVTVSL